MIKIQNKSPSTSLHNEDDICNVANHSLPENRTSWQPKTFILKTAFRNVSKFYIIR